MPNTTAREDMYDRIEERLLAMSEAYSERVTHAVSDEKLRLRRYELETHLLREHINRGRIIINGNLPVTLTYSELEYILRQHRELSKTPSRIIKSDVRVLGRDIQVEGIQKIIFSDQKPGY